MILGNQEYGIFSSDASPYIEAQLQESLNLKDNYEDYETNR